MFQWSFQIILYDFYVIVLSCIYPPKHWSQLYKIMGSDPPWIDFYSKPGPSGETSAPAEEPANAQHLEQVQWFDVIGCNVRLFSRRVWTILLPDDIRMQYITKKHNLSNEIGRCLGCSGWSAACTDSTCKGMNKFSHVGWSGWGQGRAASAFKCRRPLNAVLNVKSGR